MVNFSLLPGKECIWKFLDRHHENIQLLSSAFGFIKDVTPLHFEQYTEFKILS